MLTRLSESWPAAVDRDLCLVTTAAASAQTPVSDAINVCPDIGPRLPYAFVELGAHRSSGSSASTRAVEPAARVIMSWVRCLSRWRDSESPSGMVASK